MIKTGLSAECRGLGRVRKPRHSTSKTHSSVLRPSSQRGFTLLELIVVIIVISILAGSLLKRVPIYIEQAEKAAMEQVAGALQSALVLRYGTLMARGATKEVDSLASDNPMNWLQQKPQNYAGEFYNPTPAMVAPGHWLFDLRSHDLIYVLDRSENFTPGKDGKKWIRFHTRFQYESMPGGGTRAARKDLVGTLIEPTEPYRWFSDYDASR